MFLLLFGVQIIKTVFPCQLCITMHFNDLIFISLVIKFSFVTSHRLTLFYRNVYIAHIIRSIPFYQRNIGLQPVNTRFKKPVLTSNKIKGQEKQKISLFKEIATKTYLHLETLIKLKFVVYQETSWNYVIWLDHCYENAQLFTFL